ncbi:MAG TPA: SAM-dependent methyltransferase, partial [Ilumatobacteraceae bacterium]|nr:SAM-dependent methyltransferase [Ilumatobacteraceae bacterium]
MDRPAASFPPGFFDRYDEQPDDVFYEPLRLVTHIDDGAIDAVGELYDRLALTGDVLDLMSSWISHFRAAPASLTLLGMNAAELTRNPMATATVVHDL